MVGVYGNELKPIVFEGVGTRYEHGEGEALFGEGEALFTNVALRLILRRRPSSMSSVAFPTWLERGRSKRQP